MPGDWLAHCGECPVRKITNVLTRAGIDFHQATGCCTTRFAGRGGGGQLGEGKRLGSGVYGWWD